MLLSEISCSLTRKVKIDTAEAFGTMRTGVLLKPGSPFFSMHNEFLVSITAFLYCENKRAFSAVCNSKFTSSKHLDQLVLHFRLYILQADSHISLIHVQIKTEMK